MTSNGTLSSTHANGTSNGTANPKIHLYTNHSCPYAHRAHIVLAELKLPFEETIIDLQSPRPQWYLDINPRGLVPTMKYEIPGLMESQIIYESAIVSQFLADSFPSPLLPSTREDPTAPLRRARISFFTDTWSTKVTPLQMGVMKASKEEKQAKVDEIVATVKKEIEPLLADAAPFFGGSKELTFAEAIVAPFLLRFYGLANGKFIPANLKKELNQLPNFGKWAEATMAHPSVTKIYDEQTFLDGFEKKYGKMMPTVE